jgi:hypothetical protein
MKRATRRRRARPSKILAIDIGGTHVKLLATGEVEARKIPSGEDLTPSRLVEGVIDASADWRYDGVSIGCRDGRGLTRGRERRMLTARRP